MNAMCLMRSVLLTSYCNPERLSAHSLHMTEKQKSHERKTQRGVL